MTPKQPETPTLTPPPKLCARCLRLSAELVELAEPWRWPNPHAGPGDPKRLAGHICAPCFAELEALAEQGRAKKPHRADGKPRRARPRYGDSVTREAYRIVERHVPHVLDHPSAVAIDGAMRDDLVCWLAWGEPLGTFLHAVVEGNLLRAAVNADADFDRLGHFGRWIYQSWPMGAYGQGVAEWAYRRGLRGAFEKSRTAPVWETVGSESENDDG